MGGSNAALSRDMESLEGQATFENVESWFNLMRCIHQGSVRAATLWLKLAMHILWNVEKKKNLDRSHGEGHQKCRRR